MLEFDNAGVLVERLEELPSLTNAKELYLDFETSSGSPRLDSLDPWHNCSVAGAAITVDDAKQAWYVPRNVLDAGGAAWLDQVVRTAGLWTNHNVKYDMHVARNDLGIEPCSEVLDTVVAAKIIDSDRMYKGGYGLDALSKHWLSDDISRYEAAIKTALGRNNKDYGSVPVDIMAEYACQDVLSNRRLHRYERAQLPAECKRIWDIEQKLTSLLWRCEQRGMRIDVTQTQIERLLTIDRMLKIEAKLAEKVGFTFRPHVNDDCFQVLCNTYGLPVLAWTQEGEDGQPAGNPSFDKNALELYRAHPYAPHDVVSMIQEYRKLHTFESLFLTTFLTQHIDGVMHPSYNQAVRTGRMSCSNPNAQQFNKRAKALIKPSPGYGFLSSDYSQIEFRTIVHYIDDQNAIGAYLDDPDTDFHAWVAGFAGVHRKPAKTLNFMMGYGGGKKRAVATLSNIPEVARAVKAEIDQMGLPEAEQLATYTRLCSKRALDMYDKYHETLPTLKPTSRRCARTCRERGYVYNLFGRRRHLPKEQSHIAFNSINQSLAADIMKERAVALEQEMRGEDVHMVANVHDEILLEVPLDRMGDLRLTKRIADCMETLTVPLRVPIRCKVGTSTLSWADTDEGSEHLNLNWLD